MKKKNTKLNNRMYTNKKKNYDSDEFKFELEPLSTRELEEINQYQKQHKLHQDIERTQRLVHAMNTEQERRKKQMCLFKGIVIDCLPSSFFCVAPFEDAAENAKDFITEQEFNAFSHGEKQLNKTIVSLSSQIRKLRLTIELGDMVEYECHILYPQRGRILYRYMYQKAELTSTRKILYIQ